MDSVMRSGSDSRGALEVTFPLLIRGLLFAVRDLKAVRNLLHIWHNRYDPGPEALVQHPPTCCIKRNNLNLQRTMANYCTVLYSCADIFSVNEKFASDDIKDGNSGERVRAGERVNGKGDVVSGVAL